MWEINENGLCCYLCNLHRLLEETHVHYHSVSEIMSVKEVWLPTYCNILLVHIHFCYIITHGKVESEYEWNECWGKGIRFRSSQKLAIAVRREIGFADDLCILAQSFQVGRFSSCAPMGE